MTLQFTPFPILTTPRLVLRQMRAGDAPWLFVMRSDPAIMKYIPRPVAKAEDEVLALIELCNDFSSKNEAITWAITEKGKDELIGTIGFVHIEKEHFRAEVGYLLHPACHGKGIMKEALTAVMDYGFQVLGAHSLEAVTDPDNTASAMLLEKCGFVKEAHLKENKFILGRFWDAVIYSKLSHIPAT